MSPARMAALITLSMLAFAGNSLSCRAALEHTTIDPASFTSIRPVSGTLLLLFGAMQATMIGQGIWAGERFANCSA